MNDATIDSSDEIDLLLSDHIFQQCVEHGMDPSEENLSYERFQSLGLSNWDLRLVEEGTYSYVLCMIFNKIL